MKKFVLTVLMLMTLSSLLLAKDRFYSDPALADLKFPQIMTYYYPTNTPSEYGLIPRVELYSDPRAGKATEKAVLPSRYDMREEGFMPPIRNQSPWGTCWAHAMLGTAEVSAMMKYGDFASLSPLALALWKKPILSDSLVSPLDTGGNWNPSYFKSLDGPVSEADCPYQEPWMNPSVKYGVNLPGYVTATKSVRFPALIVDEDEDVKFRIRIYDQGEPILVNRINAIKEFVYNNGAMYVSYGSNSDYVTDNCYIFVDNEEDSTLEKCVGHAVCIVGWDDYFDMGETRFKSQPNLIDPDKDNGGLSRIRGAFLIRNSWGTGNVEGGYYWMSYVDRTLGDSGCGCEFTAMSEIKYNKAVPISSLNTVTEPGQYLKNARYALVRSTMSESGIAYALRYQSGSVTQASFVVTNETTGQSVNASFDFDYPGYQTCNFDEPLKYKAGDVIEIRLDNDVNNDGDSAIGVELPENNTGISNSYLSDDGENWYNVNANISADLMVKSFDAPEKISGVTSKVSLFSDEVYQLKYKVVPETANQEVIFESTDTKVATVSATGLIRPKNSGICDIIVRSADDPDVYAVCKVRVVIKMERIILDKTSVFIDANKKQKVQLTARIIPENATDADKIKWQTNNAKIATIKDGVITPVGIGVCQVRCISTSDKYPKVSAICTVTIGVHVEKIKITSYPVSLYLGSTGSIKGSVYPSNATNKKVIFTSSDDSVIQVNEKGNVKAVGYGSAVITVSSLENPEITASCEIYVDVPIAKIILNSVKYIGKVGGTYTLIAKTYPKEASAKGIVWKSNKPDYVSVDSNGKIKFLKATPKGKYVTITCYASNDKNVKATCKVKVN